MKKKIIILFFFLSTLNIQFLNADEKFLSLKKNIWKHTTAETLETLYIVLL